MSLRTRLLLSYVLIIFLCLGISTITVSALLQRYRDQSVMTNMDSMTKPIYNQIRTLLRGQTTIADAWEAIQEQAQNNNIYILFVDDRGNILRQATPENTQPLSVPVSTLPHALALPDHGLFNTSSGQTFVYSAYPLAKITDTLTNRAQTIILTQPRGSVEVIMVGVIRPFFWTGIIAFIAALLLAYIIARSIYHPVQRLSKAASNIAQGHYDEKVEVSGPLEIKNLATNFNEMAAKVKDSQQQMRHFVADVSHQLRSPLTSIQGFAQAMLDGTAGDEETKQKAAHIIEDESRRMIRQVNELLEFSRMQAGQVKMDIEPVETQELLQHCQEIFTLRLEEKKITLKSTLQPATVTGDADRLEDVFSNLLDNAIKNTPAGGEIQITLNHAQNKMVEVTIADNGPGIPPEQIPHVFERFQQSNGLRTGFGLGLAIAREIILAHKGQINVSSNPGEGARFTVVLPSNN